MILEIFYQDDKEFINSLDYSLLISKCIINSFEKWTNYITIYKR